MLVVSLILLCLNIILMIVFYRKVSRNFSQNAYRDRIREEVTRLIIDIEHESDHAVTVLEDKIQQIEKLMTDTDRHLALVEQEHEKWDYQKQFIEKHQPAKDSVSLSAETTKQDSIKIYSKPLGAPQIVAETSPTIDPREQVLEFARQGFSIDFIAERVDLPLGEIALILSIDR